MPFIVLPRSSELRGAVEDAIKRRYWSDYQARLRVFPDVLVAQRELSGEISSGAGIRFGDRSLFVEHYLDIPVEHALAREFGCLVDRRRVVEICHLVAIKPGHALPFVRRLIAFVRTDAEWAIFTATRPLRDLLHRNGIAMIELADAERGRMLEPGDWGSYFEHEPKVMAVSRAAVALPIARRIGSSAAKVRAYA